MLVLIFYRQVTAGRYMKSIILIMVLLANVHISPCCSSSDSVQVRTPAPPSPSVTAAQYTVYVVQPPRPIDVYRAQTALREYKSSHPRAVEEAAREVGPSVEAIDRFLISRHLRSQSRHLEHVREVWANQHR